MLFSSCFINNYWQDFYNSLKEKKLILDGSFGSLMVSWKSRFIPGFLKFSFFQILTDLRTLHRLKFPKYIKNRSENPQLSWPAKITSFHLLYTCSVEFYIVKDWANAVLCLPCVTSWQFTHLDLFNLLPKWPVLESNHCLHLCWNVSAHVLIKYYL